MPTKKAAAKGRVEVKRRMKSSKSPLTKKPLRDPRAAALREQLADLVRRGGAHVDFDKAIAKFPASLRGTRPQGLPFSAWELLEHIRIAQWDILEFCRNPKHVSPEWPSGYWPPTTEPPTGAWEKSIKAVRADLRAMERLVTDPASDLFAPIPHGDGQTLLREALLVADHNAYHLGEFVILRRLLGVWEK